MAAITPSSFASIYDTDLTLTERAFHAIKSQKAIVLAVSGKLGAGKDSVAPPVMKELGHANAIHEFFAKPLKDEVDQAIFIISESLTAEIAANFISTQQNITPAQAIVVVTRLWQEVKSGAVLTSRTRTDNTRFVLQFWGTDIRRIQDENYWVKLAIASTLEKLAAGNSVFVTDARFENEIDSLAALGAYTVRLKVSKDVQANRIKARDGMTPTDEARNHVSETALDHYETLGQFTVVIDTDLLSSAAVVLDILAEIDRVNS